MAEHIFLTGGIQVGKSTIIDKVVGRLGLAPAGFRTFWDGAGDSGVERLFVAPYGAGFGANPRQSATATPFGNPRQSATATPFEKGAEGAEGADGWGHAALRTVGGPMLETHPEVFDGLGVRILEEQTRGGAARRAGLLVMDELGFIEGRALIFQKAVLECLGGDVPVLGVVKPRRTPFLDAVRAHEGVRVIEVTRANRDALADGLTKSLSRIRPK